MPDATICPLALRNMSPKETQTTGEKITVIDKLAFLMKKINTLSFLE